MTPAAVTTNDDVTRRRGVWPGCRLPRSAPPCSGGWVRGARVTEIGRTLARWRVPLGYVLGAAALWFAEPTWRSLGIGAAVGTIGEAVRIWAAGHLEKGREGTTSGPYAVTRHPLYLGSTLMGAGFAVAGHSVPVAALGFAAHAVTILPSVRAARVDLISLDASGALPFRRGESAREVRRVVPRGSRGARGAGAAALQRRARVAHP